MDCRFPSILAKANRALDLTFDVSHWTSLNLGSVGLRFSLVSRCSSSTQGRANNMVVNKEVRVTYKTEV